MNEKITTLEEIKTLFTTMTNQKVSAGLTKQQAEDVAVRQIIKDAKAGEIDEAVTREFAIQCHMARGGTREVADLAVTNLFEPIA